MENSRIYNKWPFAKEGLPFICAGWLVALVFALVGLSYIAILTGLISLFTCFFFRDPERHNRAKEGEVLTPADGKILGIERLNAEQSPSGEPALKISIFMSIFNVHVNRAPAGGTIKKISYLPGRFFAASLDKASELNERNIITLETTESRPIVFIQIAGLIARRIACWVKEGDRVAMGQRFGLIRFGSRLEVYLPHGSEIRVIAGQKVKAGITVIGNLP